MREILLTGTRKLFMWLFVCTLIIMVNLWAAGRLMLMAGLLTGYVAGLLWYGVMFGRLWRSADMSIAQAKHQMVMGMVLRLIMLGAVLAVMIQISFGQFLATVAGFAIVYVLGLLLLILANKKLFSQ